MAPLSVHVHMATTALPRSTHRRAKPLHLPHLLRRCIRYLLSRASFHELRTSSMVIGFVEVARRCSTVVGTSSPADLDKGMVECARNVDLPPASPDKLASSERPGTIGSHAASGAKARNSSGRIFDTPVARRNRGYVTEDRSLLSGEPEASECSAGVIHEKMDLIASAVPAR
eukprot:CAMPEP_0176129902 /NCGR_PEP_ID=MMETSP0120_2-20121206/65707_1 /TAXON_ID=160619 /ORGANISM="Kryptoperidinium foliaceum, Strain CCMP 1326" /LENGTH=171 /DNA_ID=CAMNT_0017465147 /DNA_START=143 /DNA_END=654 /DNA_ORIENTATION=-